MELSRITAAIIEITQHPAIDIYIYKTLPISDFSMTKLYIFYKKEKKFDRVFLSSLRKIHFFINFI